MTAALRFYASLWTLREYPSRASEWSLDEKFAAVRREGFEAIGGRLLPEAPELCARHELDYVLFLDVDASNYEEQLRRAPEWNPRRVNIQLCDHDTAPTEAAEIWIKVMEQAEALGLNVDLETHRDTATETPEKIQAIADHFWRRTGKTIRFTLDFSHSAVVKHLLPPFAPRLLACPEFIRSARHFHLRPFNGHHAQIPVTDGRENLTEEFKLYREFLQHFFACFDSEIPSGEVLYACPENGPRIPGSYGLSCFPDVWHDTVRLRDEAHQLWESCRASETNRSNPTPQS
jgi:hypothetical protein